MDKSTNLTQATKYFRWQLSTRNTQGIRGTANGVQGLALLFVLCASPLLHPPIVWVAYLYEW